MEILVFKRRSPSDSEILKTQSIKEFFDHIRMLDAPGYPLAFLVYNGFKIEFSNVDMKQNELVANESKSMSHNILVVASHSDDEVLGCGGTIAEANSFWHNVATLFMTDGVSSRDGQGQKSSIQRRKINSEAAAMCWE